MTDLFGNEEPAWRQPRPAPVRPSWARVNDKGQCDRCLQRLSIDWGQHGVPFIPASRAVWRRRYGSETVYLCEEHATPLRAKDEADYPRRSK